MKRVLVASVLLAGLSAWAQSTPVGVWRNVDDKTGEVKAEIRIVETQNGLSGRIERLLRPAAEPLCTQCTDDRKDQPKQGLEIIRGGRKVESKDVWEGGRILDPENGREYKARLTPTEGGTKLDVRGSIGPFGRTQTWVRVQ